MNEIRLDESQHRLLMCMRIAKALNAGSIYLDATNNRMHWRLEKNERTIERFRSICEMEAYLEHRLSNRSRSSIRNMGSFVKRRMTVIRERDYARTNGTAMLFSSNINN